MDTGLRLMPAAYEWKTGLMLLQGRDVVFQKNLKTAFICMEAVFLNNYSTSPVGTIRRRI